jgi:hypothetical protein
VHVLWGRGFLCLLLTARVFSKFVPNISSGRKSVLYLHKTVYFTRALHSLCWLKRSHGHSSACLVFEFDRIPLNLLLLNQHWMLSIEFHIYQHRPPCDPHLAPDSYYSLSNSHNGWGAWYNRGHVTYETDVIEVYNFYLKHSWIRCIEVSRWYIWVASALGWSYERLWQFSTVMREFYSETAFWLDKEYLASFTEYIDAPCIFTWRRNCSHPRKRHIPRDLNFHDGENSYCDYMGYDTM